MFEKVFQFARNYVNELLLGEKLKTEKEKLNQTLIVEAGTEGILGNVIRNWYIMEQIPNVQLPFERKNFIRVSYLSREFCSVEEVYCSLHNINRQRKIAFPEYLKMRVGTFIHKLLDTLIELEGQWVCLKCSAKFSTKLEICSYCGSKVEYFLDEFFDDEIGIKGTPDGITTRNGEKYLVELKTVETDISDKKFNEAIIQLNLYMHLTKIKKGLLIILPRLNPRNIEEYFVEFNNELVEIYLNKVKIVWEYLKRNEVPWHLAKDCKRKSCLLRGECLIEGKF